MENIILTNNKDLRLVSVKVGVLSTLRFELPLVSASATHVEVIVTSGDVPSAYTATFIDATKRWQCDIAASQFPTVGRQSYEVAYVLDGKQFWDGKGWIEIEDATTSGIEPQPRPEPYRYAVVSVNGYGADAQGAVRIPKTFIATDSPTTTEGYMEGDIYFNRETGATWTLCDVQGTLTWVFNYKNYYTKAETDEAIDRVAAYYITYDAAGNPFPTYSALSNATTVYSGGVVRIPTRNDYCVVLADETHDNAEYRYIYAVAEGQTTGSWQPQFPVEGVMTVDQTVQKNSQNPVSGGGVWSVLWGALSALPTGFSSLYDWCVAQLAGKASKADATLTNKYTDWVVVGNLPPGSTWDSSQVWYDPSDDYWKTWLHFDGGEDHVLMKADGAPYTTLELTFEGEYDGDELSMTTRRSFSGYQLGSQADKPLASEAEAEALRTGKLDKSGGTVRGEFGVAGTYNENFQVVPEIDDQGTYTPPTMRFGDGAGVVGIVWRIVDGHVVMDVTDIFGVAYRIALPSATSGTLALLSQIGIPAFDSAATYAVGAKVVYDNAVWNCTTAVSTPDVWSPAYWTKLFDLAADSTPTVNSDSLMTSGAIKTALDAKANASDIPYSLGTPTVIDTASSEVVEGETVYYGAATLADRTANIVQVTAATALDELRITFPAATSGKVCDFGLRVEIGTGSAALTAPALVPIAPTGETIKIENNAAEIPALADGTASAKGVTLLYFSETASGVFVVKGEQVEEVA